MRREVAGDGDEHVAALLARPAFAELADSGLQHLVGMEAHIFAQQHMRVAIRSSAGCLRVRDL
jgi:hypothetical protein